MSGYKRPRKPYSKKNKAECIQILDNVNGRRRKKEKQFRPATSISLSSLKAAIILIKTHNQSKVKTRQIVESSCQIAADKHVAEESYQITLLYIEHNTFSYMKEIFLQSVLKADFLISAQVLCSMLETENVSLLLHSIYFKKAALLIYLYSKNISLVKDFFKFAHLLKKSKPSEEDLFKGFKKILKLKPHY